MPEFELKVRSPGNAHLIFCGIKINLAIMKSVPTGMSEMEQYGKTGK